MALSTYSRIVSNRSSALFLGFSFAGRSLGGFVAGGVGFVSVFGGSEGLATGSGVVDTVGLIWLIFRSISSIFSWKLLRRSLSQIRVRRGRLSSCGCLFLRLPA